MEDGFGIPPSLLDGQSQPGRNPSADPNQQLLMMIDADEDGSSSIDSDRQHENRTRSEPVAKRKLGSDQRDWESNREKPFKCTVPGCEKAYKQPNGLKYHKAHGHCSQVSRIS
jgi:transcription factor SFP1